MSKYTTEVRNICETYAGLTDRAEYTDVENVLNDSYTKIFDVDNIPVYIPEHKSVLLKKILLHYYQREIAFETVGLWKLKLNTKLKEIMPYYNQLYASELLEYDPLQNVNNWHEHQGVYEDTSKVDNKRKYDNTTDTENAEVAEKTRKYDNEVNTDHAEVSSKTSKYDNTTDTDNAKAMSRNLGQNETSTDNINTSYQGEEEVLLKHKKTTSQAPGSKTHTVTNPRDQWTLYSDTPQGGLDGVAAGGGVEAGTSVSGNQYLTNATHVIDKDAQTTDTTNYGTITEQYNDNSNLKDTTDRSGQESSLDQFSRGMTENESQGNTEQGKRVDNALTKDDAAKADNGKRVEDALTHDNSSKAQDGKRVDDALTVDDNLKKDNGSDAHTNREYGKIGVLTYQEMVLKYRETFLNIDMMIIDELRDLFMKVW